MTRGLRGAVVAVLALAHLTLAAGPASAHGVATAGPPNWESRVTTPATDGLAWSVVGVDAALRLVNTSGREVLVRGYGGEPYLRIGPDGVFENRRARTTWLNLDRYGDLTGVVVPDDVGSDAPPAWTRVHDRATWTWFDHRIHWMNPRRLPPGVAVDPAAGRVVQQWEVEAEQAGAPVGPTGVLVWHRTPLAGIGPWLLPLVAAVALAATVVVTARGHRARLAVATGLLAVAGLGAWHEVGTLLGLGAVVPDGQVVDAAVRSGVVVLVALAGIAGLRRGDRWARWLLVAVAVTVAVVVGAREVEVLRAPVPRGPMPPWATRALVAVALAAPAPALAAAWSGRRR